MVCWTFNGFLRINLKNSDVLNDGLIVCLVDIDWLSMFIMLFFLVWSL